MLSEIFIVCRNLNWTFFKKLFNIAMLSEISHDSKYLLFASKLLNPNRFLWINFSNLSYSFIIFPVFHVLQGFKNVQHLLSDYSKEAHWR